MKFFRSRAGMSLVELLIFIAVLGIVVSVGLPILFSSTENRVLQQTVSIVEHNGIQVLQNMEFRIHHAERILFPPMGEAGSFLALQTASGATNPTIIGYMTGSLAIVERATRERISSSQVAITDFTVRNTSASSTRQSVHISFRVSRTIKLQQPHSYIQWFEATIPLYPADDPVGENCGCMDPMCAGNDIVEWMVCEEETCLTGTTPLICP